MPSRQQLAVDTMTNRAKSRVSRKDRLSKLSSLRRSSRKRRLLPRRERRARLWSQLPLLLPPLLPLLPTPPLLQHLKQVLLQLLLHPPLLHPLLLLLLLRKMTLLPSLLSHLKALMLTQRPSVSNQVLWLPAKLQNVVRALVRIPSPLILLMAMIVIPTNPSLITVSPKPPRHCLGTKMQPWKGSMLVRHNARAHLPVAG